MKKLLLPTLPLIAAIAFPASALAQDTPAPDAAPAAPDAPAQAAPSTPAAPAKPLTASDKTFIKKTLDSMFFILSLTENRRRENIQLEATKKTVQKINAETTKIWGEVAKVASDHQEKIPSEVTGGDKSKLNRVSKADGTRFDKDLMKLLTKETADLEKAFESGSKSLQNPELKTIAGNWLPTIRGLSNEAQQTEKEIAKAK